MFGIKTPYLNETKDHQWRWFEFTILDKILKNYSLVQAAANIMVIPFHLSGLLRIGQRQIVVPLTLTFSKQFSVYHLLKIARSLDI